MVPEAFGRGELGMSVEILMVLRKMGVHPADAGRERTGEHYGEK